MDGSYTFIYPVYNKQKIIINYVVIVEDVTIQKELMPQSKTVLLTQREDIGFKSKTYEVQLEELKDWIVKHKDLYKYFC